MSRPPRYPESELDFVLTRDGDGVITGQTFVNGHAIHFHRLTRNGDVVDVHARGITCRIVDVKLHSLVFTAYHSACKSKAEDFVAQQTATTILKELSR